MSGVSAMKRAKSVGGVGKVAPEGEETVLVAVTAAREISKAGLLWALTHVVRHGCCITLLVIVRPRSSCKTIWGFPRFAGDCANGYKNLHHGTPHDQNSDVYDRCSQMINQLRNVYDPTKVSVATKLVNATPGGVIAVESKRARASWVVLDKQPKGEEKHCMEELQCNIVSMKKSKAKVLRLNLGGSTNPESQVSPSLPLEFEKPTQELLKKSVSCASDAHPASSPESGTVFTTTEAGMSSISSSDPGNSPLNDSEPTDGISKGTPLAKVVRYLVVTSSDSDSESSTPNTSLEFQPWAKELLHANCPSKKQVEELMSKRFDNRSHKISPSPEKVRVEPRISSLTHRSELDSHGSVREAIPISRNGPQVPPPLCSVCQHKTPEFGKPPRWFSYAELELATGGFSNANFLAEGGYGSVHRGVLPDGQAIAVKQHKLASAQGDQEFCSEVEVLSCAQHRNVVTLIGFCIEDNKRLLVYEYICNGSLDAHLYGCDRELLQWPARQKIAVGAARGLRYLHEECRVGCIVHRDMRPNNILITHDFEPLVGDFGLARWQPDGDMGVQTRVIGTFGYLAPEYAQSGQITEKADVYSFGVVLLELVAGRKAIDINQTKGRQCLTEWARPLLKKFAVDDLVDPRLANHYAKHEVCWMLHAASMCIRRDPHSRPRMSQVLRILEGDVVVEKNLYNPLSSNTERGFSFYIKNVDSFAQRLTSNTERGFSFNVKNTDSVTQRQRRHTLNRDLDVLGRNQSSCVESRTAYQEAEKPPRASFHEGD